MFGGTEGERDAFVVVVHAVVGDRDGERFRRFLGREDELLGDALVVSVRRVAVVRDADWQCDGFTAETAAQCNGHVNGLALVRRIRRRAEGGGNGQLDNLDRVALILLPAQTFSIEKIPNLFFDPVVSVAMVAGTHNIQLAKRDCPTAHDETEAGDRLVRKRLIYNGSNVEIITLSRSVTHHIKAIDHVTLVVLESAIRQGAPGEQVRVARPAVAPEQKSVQGRFNTLRPVRDGKGC